MAIFSRRTLQCLINENAEFLRPKQIKEHVRRLNNADLAYQNNKFSEVSLATEWEVVLLNVFSKIGIVEHEPILEGQKKIDLLFTLRSNSSKQFLADITTISDKGFDDKNPVEALENDLMKRVAQHGLRLDAFSLRVEGNHGKSYKGYYYIEHGDESRTVLYKGGGEKSKLKLPGIAKFAEKIFNDKFEQFLKDIEYAPYEERFYYVVVPDDDINLAIGYHPNQRFSSINYLEYRRLNHLTENRLYQSLEDKAHQLSESKFNGTLGIILCDGGYTPLQSRPDHTSHSVDEVITFFLKNHPYISFIITYTIEHKYPRKRPLPIIIKIYKDNYSDDAVIETIEKSLEVLPEPETDMFNAVNRLKGRHPQEGRKNGMTYGLGTISNKVQISARTLLELLAGRLKHEDFLRQYGFVATEEFPQRGRNPFEWSLNNGALIREISIEPSESVDDDIITIKLIGPDPAISPFQVPKTKKES